MPHLQEAVVDAVKGSPVQAQVVIGEQENGAKFRIAHAALAKSCAGTLELALAGVPMATAYPTGAMKASILRRAIKVDSVILPDLVIGANVIPVPAGRFHAGKFAAALRDMLSDSDCVEGNWKLSEGGQDHVDRQPAARRACRRYSAGDDLAGAAGEQ